ncbi:hypothetical protein [Azospirillum sp. TSO22-1]|uniref:hypothetical protein n=1 Tax=Azospirillum sp. TSO22-1 TaxID=716789 RepID=UPI000D60A67D|nr:hypothetical protein [Azospirillum sp. TSO22-1]PWC40354.1 hypothetical protein TSO221_25165 [Azospirillum sp. TSO22-1]
MSTLHEKPMRERLARWVRSSAPAVVSGATTPEEVVDALLDVMLSAPDSSLIHEAGRGELPSRSADEAKAVFVAMIEAIKSGAS